ncbi:SM-like, degradation of cytoplasmic mRNAs and positively regulates transcription initiation [Arachnomyces sp. PD_36]|nr:SM-like, degradation of cytoplasmic mRNAs and positively regulates transcription initiation [Arachnomyces sp. PD_36]
MEHLSLQDNPGGKQSGPHGPGQSQQQPHGPAQLGSASRPQAPPQLPPQMFTTAAQLLDMTDTNLVLQDTVERIYAGKLYADRPRGVYLVRGENVLLLGEIDLDKEDFVPPPFQQAPLEEVFELKKQEENERKRNDKRRNGKMQDLGFEAEHSGEVLF